MADKVEGDKLQVLICPMCVDVFMNATILQCGHTFCKGCLETYDEQQNDLRAHLTCPVCKEITKLGPNRIAGLTRNFSVKGLADALNVEPASSKSEEDDISSKFCFIHKTDERTIFCEVCEEFICISCFIAYHQGHKIKKKEELERELTQKTDGLFENCKERNAEIEKSFNICYRDKLAMDSHLDKMDKEVRDTFAKKFTILQSNEKILLEKIDVLRSESVKEMDNCISDHAQLKNTMDKSIAALTVDTSKHFHTLKSHYLKRRELNNLLKEPIRKVSVSHVRTIVESARFRAADEKVLELGCIELGSKAEVRHVPEQSTPGSVRRESEEKPENKMADIPAVVRKRPLKIVRNLNLTHAICGMAPLSKDAVVVGYGGMRKGSDCVFVSGYKKSHLKNTVGHVNGIAFLADGRPVVGQSKNAFSVYDPHGNYNTGRQQCTPGNEFLAVCTDQQDNIYAVNGNTEIYVFQDAKLQRVIPTGAIDSKQICVTKTGDIMISSTCDSKPSTVTVFDREGQIGTSFKARCDAQDDVFYYAAVDSQDRVLVARVKEFTDAFKLTRYTLRGRNLIKQMMVNQFELPEYTDTAHCCMVSLTPRLIAFGSGTILYFMELAD